MEKSFGDLIILKQITILLRYAQRREVVINESSPNPVRRNLGAKTTYEAANASNSFPGPHESYIAKKVGHVCWKSMLRRLDRSAAMFAHQRLKMKYRWCRPSLHPLSTMSATVDFTANRGPEVNVVAWAFTGVAIATVTLKLIARASIVKTIGWDDFFIFLSLACSIIAAAFVSYSVTLGLGRHTQAILLVHGKERLVATAKWQILGFPFNIASFSFPNISIAILVNKLLDPNPWRSGLLLALCIVQVLLACTSVCLIYLQCSPAEGLWNPFITSDCWDPSLFNDFNYFVSGYTAMTDFVLAIVPIMAFWKLQMPYSTKLGVCTMMGLTMLSAVVTIVKACYLHLFTDKTDPLYNVVPLVIWGLIEQNVVIVAACVPTVRPVFHKAFRTWQTRSRSRSEGSTPKIRSGRSGSTYRLSSNPVHNHERSQSQSKRLTSPHVLDPRATQDDVSDRPTEPTHPDAESNNSQQSTSPKGIWQTRVISVRHREEVNLDELEEGRRMRVLPDCLRTNTDGV